MQCEHQDPRNRGSAAANASAPRLETPHDVAVPRGDFAFT